MLFGCLPIVNIPVFIAGIGVLAFSAWIFWTDHENEKHEQGIERVRRCEVHRRAIAAMEYGKRSRANHMSRYRGLV